MKGLRFSKTFPDGKYISMEIVSNKKHLLAAHNIFMEKSDYTKKKSLEHTLSVQSNAQDQTSETQGAQNSFKIESSNGSMSDTNIAQKKNGVKNSIRQQPDSDTQKYIAGNPDEWAITSEGVKGENTEALSRIVDDIRKAFNIPVSTGKMRQRNALGIYKTHSEAIRTRVGDDLATVSHELGHHLDKRCKLTDLATIGEVMRGADSEFLQLYPTSQRPGEAAALHTSHE